MWIFQKDSSVAPFSLSISFYFFFSPFSIFCIFWWPQWLFLFNSHLSSLGSFNCVHFGIFSSLKGNTLFYKKVKEIFHTLQGTQNHKEDVAIMMYAMYVAASVAGTCMT